jgi:hypothetical protein
MCGSAASTRSSTCRRSRLSITPRIIEILAAFVREHAQLPARSNAHHEARRRPVTNVQASLTILGRRDARPRQLGGGTLAHDNDAPIGLVHTALACATLTGAHLERALMRART